MIFRTTTVPATDDTGTRVCVKFFDGIDDCVESVAWDYSSYDAHETAALDVAKKWADANGFESDSCVFDRDYNGGVLLVRWLPKWE